MTRLIKIGCTLLMATSLVACGGSTTGDGGTNEDGGANQDLAVTLFKLQSGTYTVMSINLGNDGCNVGTTGIVGSTQPLTNDGAGNIALGPLAGMNPQEHSNGASCPGSPANPACATDAAAVPFNNNQGSLVRDNDVDDMAGCTFHRHVLNQLTLTADNTFNADYTRKDTNHAGCAQATDCTTTWTWTLARTGP